MHIKELLRSAKESFLFLRKNYNILWIGIIVELAFLFSISFITTFLFGEVIRNNLGFLSDEIVKGVEGGQGIVDVLSSSPYFSKVIIWHLILALVIYLIYCLFQGYMWRYSFNLIGEKKKYVPYIKRFFKVNLLWFPLFVIYWIIDLILLYSDTVSQRFDVDGNFFASRLSIILLYAILYFAFISYVLISNSKPGKSIKGSFKLGIKNVHWILLMYLVIILIIEAANYLLFLIGQKSEVLVIFFGVFIVIPLMIYSRVFIKSVVDKL